MVTPVVEPSLALMAMSSSPVRIQLRVMVMFFACSESMPSVLRAVLGVSMRTPQTVNPSPR